MMSLNIIFVIQNDLRNDLSGNKKEQGSTLGLKFYFRQSGVDKQSNKGCA